MHIVADLIKRRLFRCDNQASQSRSHNNVSQAANTDAGEGATRSTLVHPTPNVINIYRDIV
jgi:hypothetical protein